MGFGCKLYLHCNEIGRKGECNIFTSFCIFLRLPESASRPSPTLWGNIWGLGYFIESSMHMHVGKERLPIDEEE